MISRSRLFGEHPRSFQDHRYVYPVVSRRSRGLSVGINLNPDQRCNFDCVYCSVERGHPLPEWAHDRVDLERLATELDETLSLVTSGDLFEAPPFDQTPAPLRRLNDVAFSGDGEPTTSERFAEACELAARALYTHGLHATKLLLLTNATLLDRPEVERGLVHLDGRPSEIWAKLDAGTEAHFRAADGAHTSLGHICRNLLHAGQRRPLVVQSMFARMHGAPPPPDEIEAWVGRLAALSAGGCQISRVQVYTVARRPAKPWVAPLTTEELDAIAARVQALGLAVERHD